MLGEGICLNKLFRNAIVSIAFNRVLDLKVINSLHGLTGSGAWIGNYVQSLYGVWPLTHGLLQRRFTYTAIEVRACMSSYTSTLCVNVITYPYPYPDAALLIALTNTAQRSTRTNVRLYPCVRSRPHSTPGSWLIYLIDCWVQSVAVVECVAILRWGNYGSGEYDHDGDNDNDADANMFPNSMVHRAKMGPIWGRQDPGRPIVGHMNLAFLIVMIQWHVQHRLELMLWKYVKPANEILSWHTVVRLNFHLPNWEGKLYLAIRCSQIHSFAVMFYSKICIFLATISKIWIWWLCHVHGVNGHQLRILRYVEIIIVTIDVKYKS